MDEKIPVKIEPMQRMEHSFGYMYYCTKCGAYTTLAEEGCLKCHGKKLTSFDQMINQICKQRNKKRILFLLNIFLAVLILGGFIFPISVKELIIGFLVLIISCASIIFVQIRFGESLRTLEVDKILKAEGNVIEKSLNKDFEQIKKDIEKEQYLIAYKKLRSLGTIIKSDKIKKAKIYCLNKFALRSDIPLEMDEVLLSYYHKGLVAYIYEVSKVQRNLIKQPTIKYIAQNEEYILEDFDNANLIFGNIAGASIYSKSSLEHNKDFILRYIKYIPKDRLARIQKLVYSNVHYDWEELKGALYEEV